MLNTKTGRAMGLFLYGYAVKLMFYDAELPQR